MNTMSPPSIPMNSRYSSASVTLLQRNVTGDETFVALSAGAIVAGAALLHRAVALTTLKSSRFERSGGQPSNNVSTYQVYEPAARSRVALVAFFTKTTSANGWPESAIQTR